MLQILEIFDEIVLENPNVRVPRHGRAAHLLRVVVDEEDLVRAQLPEPGDLLDDCRLLGVLLLRPALQAEPFRR